MARPPKFKTANQMQVIVDKYFNDCKNEEIPHTIEMLCFELGLTRETLLKYEELETFSDTIKNAKQFIYAKKMEKLNSSGSNTAGIIFDLCNNGKYTNKHNETDKGIHITINDKTKEIAHD